MILLVQTDMTEREHLNRIIRLIAGNQFDIIRKLYPMHVIESFCGNLDKNDIQSQFF